MKRLIPVRSLDVKAPLGRKPFISAASGITFYKNQLFIVADDELELAVFELQSSEPGRLFKLLPGELPLDPKKRKARKPDWEAITRIQQTLIVVPSGSTAHRCAGVSVHLSNEGDPLPEMKPLDFSPLYERLNKEFGELNIEGCVATSSHFKLLQRGNGKAQLNAIIDLDRKRIEEALTQGRITPDLLVGIRTYQLGQLGGVTLSFTDACSLKDGRLVFVAAAEESPNTYEDGKNRGSVLGALDPDGEILWVQELQPTMKAEGIAVLQKEDRAELFIVTDDDDPEKPAQLFFCEI